MQEFVYRGTANVEREMHDYTENKWSRQDSNKMFKERFGTIRGKHLTFSYCTWNITQNTGSTMVRNLNPERWGSPLVQEKYVNQKYKARDKKHNNNNNNPVFIPLSADHDLKVRIIEFWER